jgi:hypothetical protein
MYQKLIKCKVEVLLNIYRTLNYSNQKKKFIRLNITTITTGNAHAFKEFCCPSLHMCVMYASKGMMKMLECALSIEKYGNDDYRNQFVTFRLVMVNMLCILME